MFCPQVHPQNRARTCNQRYFAEQGVAIQRATADVRLALLEVGTRITVREWIAKVANLKFLLEEGDVDGALQIARSLEDAMGETLNDLSNEGNEGGRIWFLFLVLDVQSFGSSILPFRPSSSLVPS